MMDDRTHCGSRMPFRRRLTLILLAAGCEARRLAFGVTPRRVVLHEAFVTARTTATRRPARAVLSPWTLPRGGSTEIESDKDEEECDGDDGEESVAVEAEEGDNDDEEEENPLASVMNMEPVPIVVQTSLGSSVMDQSLELVVHRSRSISSLKQSIARQLPGRPPVTSLQLRQAGRLLEDDLLVDEIVEDDEDEDDDEEEAAMVLQLDMIPPVDPKSVPILPGKLEELTVAELLDAYTMNEAAMYQNAALLMQEEPAAAVEHEGESDETESETATATAPPPPSVTLQIKQQAARIRGDLLQRVLTSEADRKLLEDPTRPGLVHPNLQERQIRGKRVRQAAAGGVQTTLKRQIQRNLNVNWSDTLRHFMLFLFFGYFGGRTPLSRAILLLGAPGVFLLQARPVKLWLRQAWYLVSDHPPSILRSLLPAPSQAILSLDMDAAMRRIYGNAAVGVELVAEPEMQEGEETADSDVDEEEYDEDELSDDE